MSNEQTQNNIEDLISAYLSGTIDSISLAKLKRWAEMSEENAAYVRKRLEIDFSVRVAEDTTPFDATRGFETFANRIAGGTSSAGSLRKRLSWKVIFRAAAILLIIALPIGGYWLGMKTMTSAFSDIAIETPFGSHTKTVLPDGTTVWLNAGSKLSYSQGFGVENRRVVLEGEAYFDVKRNAQIPFEINTKEIDLQVLGTRFTFSDYPDDEKVTVDLIKGKVLLVSQDSRQKMYLGPDERMTYNKLTGKMVREKVNAIVSTGWTKEELVFDEEPMKDIAKTLERSYNVRIKVADSLKEKSFYGIFNRTDNSVSDILDAISMTNQMKYRHINGTYVLY